ncbi:dimethyladenosine transferase 1, mitochondrial-like [Paramacrobiotus metropolitanus]|uniref:dimethyladenosine transferase 1, mitochondrial-like n=1 Tax=Paramacrobiotus metropolitanus TaxID=2943436 RepID=UPI002445AEAE|nr:dimethyladenosine transferase 1, mitochondrial-like [Paramacrobiotus metropolitanus]
MPIPSAVRAAAAAREIVHRLPPLPTIGEILRIYRLRALKQLSQNFLLEPKLTNKIARAAGNLDNCCVLEIGPGPGSLTRSIISAGNIRELTVIERDARFIPVLNELKDASDTLPFHIINDDILRTDLQGIFPEDTVRPWLSDELPPLHIIANLPFNIATPLLIKFLSHMSSKTDVFRFGRVQLTLMFQHEVAQRIIAVPGDRQRCRLSIMCQNYCDVKYAFPIRGTSFVPKPDVDAGVVILTPRKEPAITQPFKMVEKVVRTTFTMKRKPFVRALGYLFPRKGYERVHQELIDRSRIDPQKPTMLLELEEYRDLLCAYEKVCQEYPELDSFRYI